MQTARAFIAAKVRLLLSALHVINAWVGLAMAALGHRARRYFCFCLTLLAVWQSVSEAQLKPADDDSKAQGVQVCMHPLISAIYLTRGCGLFRL